MEQIFKMGDRVFHIQYGWGEVRNGSFDLVNVIFDLGTNVTFNFKLRSLLSFTEYTLEGFSQDRLVELPEIGQVVWGKNIDQVDWHIGHFHIFDRNSISLKYCISSNPTGGKTLWVQQITTTNPYANEHN